LIRTYALAFINDGLRKNQIHIGKRAVALSISLIRTALDAAIKEACGFIPDIQKTAQKHYLDAVSLIQESGFTCSLSNRIATKKDITRFLKIPESTLNGFLRKHKDEIRPIHLDSAAIHSLGCRAKSLNGYHLDDVAKIAFGMDTEVGIELKKRMFGQIGMFARPQTRDEIQWRKAFSQVFQGFGLHFNYSIGKYRVDFFVARLMLVLECNGYDHRYYDPKDEEEREKAITKRYALVRFHHRISLETLFNGILQARPGKIVRLYDLEHISPEVAWN
jgi:very-short-patch-repair endonuclease